MDSIEKSKHLPAIYKTIAQSEDCIFIDLNKIAKVSETDGLHYKAEEHQKIAQAMFELLNKIKKNETHNPSQFHDLWILSLFRYNSCTLRVGH